GGRNADRNNCRTGTQYSRPRHTILLPEPEGAPKAGRLGKGPATWRRPGSTLLFLRAEGLVTVRTDRSEPLHRRPDRRLIRRHGRHQRRHFRAELFGIGAKFLRLFPDRRKRFGLMAG